VSWARGTRVAAASGAPGERVDVEEVDLVFETVLDEHRAGQG